MPIMPIMPMMPEIPEAIKTLTKCVLQKWHIGAFRKETKGIVAGVKVLLRWD